MGSSMVTEYSLFTELQSRFAPVPKGLHIGFAIIATILFIVLYIRKKKLSDILWLLICDATVILQFFGDKATALAVGICEVILIALLILQTRAEAKEESRKKASENSGEPDSEADALELEKLVRAERKAIIDDNKVDVIADAFDGEDAVK